MLEGMAGADSAFEAATKSEPEPVERFTLRSGVVVEPGFRVVVHGKRETKARTHC
jgi:hypothetical protein